MKRIIKCLIETVCKCNQIYDKDFAILIFDFITSATKLSITTSDLNIKLSTIICKNIHKYIKEQNFSANFEIIESLEHFLSNAFFAQCFLPIFIKEFLGRARHTDVDKESIRNVIILRILNMFKSEYDSFNISEEVSKNICSEVFKMLLLTNDVEKYDEIPELSSSVVQNSKNTIVFNIIQQRPFLVQFLLSCLQKFESSKHIKCLAFQLSITVLLHVLFSLEKNITVIRNSFLSSENLLILESSIELLAKVAQLPLFLRKSHEILPEISSNEALLVLSDMYNHIRGQVTLRDVKYRFNSVMQNNITSVAPKFWIMREWSEQFLIWIFLFFLPKTFNLNEI